MIRFVQVCRLCPGRANVRCLPFFGWVFAATLNDGHRKKKEYPIYEFFLSKRLWLGVAHNRHCGKGAMNGSLWQSRILS